MNPRNWTLRTRLTALVVVLLSVVSVVIGGVSFAVVSVALSHNFDTEVQNALQRYARIPDSDSGSTSDAPRNTVDAGTIIVGYPQNSTTLVGLRYRTAASGSTAASVTKLTAAQLAQITKAQFTQSGNGAFATVNVTGLGNYRFYSAFNGALTLGLPTSTLDVQIAALLGPIGLIVAGAILLAAVAAALTIQRALRPLRRVAAVASNVAQMPLERGEVQLVARVPAHDTNPRTEVGQVGAALNSLLESVETALAVRQASEAKVRHFVADASHELRTPLASIRGYAELTRRFGSVDETSEHNVERIESEAKRMTSLVEDLLLLARLDAQRELEVVDVELSRLLVDVVSDAHAASGDHEWDLELPEEPVVVRGDDAKLHQVFVNLLANARVHTPAGTRVSIELAPPRDGEVEVRVRDNGPGIPESLMPSLFERFVRGDSSRNRTTGSTGLGLSIVAAVVRAHGGVVEVESEPGDTSFVVRLPVSGVVGTVQSASVRVPDSERGSEDLTARA